MSANDKPVFLGQQEIGIELLHPNPRNPRKSYHFLDDNPRIGEMADSLKLSGQHNPIKCYEKPDQPGHFMIVQGHRRYFSALKASVHKLEATIVQPPKNLAEELRWLASEDSLRDDWGLYSKMELAKEMAEAEGVAIDSRGIAAQIGLTLPRLQEARKMFSLDPAIYGHVARWEEIEYFAKVVGTGTPTKGFPGDSRIKASDFSPSKAASTWDIFCILREKYKSLVEKFEDIELQAIIASHVSHTKKSDVERFQSLLNSMHRSPGPGQLAQVMTWLEQPAGRSSISSIVRTTKNVHQAKLVDTSRLAERLASACTLLEKMIDDVGHDPEVLTHASRNLAQAAWKAERLQVALDKKVKGLERGVA